MKITTSNNLELDLINKGYSSIVGLDEVGRGPWAGPVTTASFLYDSCTKVIDGVTDSKKLSDLRREYLYKYLTEDKSKYSVVSIENTVIDSIGIAESVRVAMQTSVENLNISKDGTFLLIDGGTREILDYEQLKINKGDLWHYSIAAASIIAKVTRDRLMKEFSEMYPEYGFERHVGYGTKFHIEMLAKYGPCKIHRFSYKPLAKYLENAKKIL